MAEWLSGWYRLFIIFAILWTTVMIIGLVVGIVTPGNEPYPFFELIWLVPIGGVYGIGWCVGWIMRVFRKEN